MRFTRQRQTGQLVFLPGQNRFDDPVHQQIRVAANRTGEMGIRLIRQTKVTAVDGGVNRLLHRAQQHGVTLLRIRALFGRLGDVLKLARLGVVAQAKTQAQGFEVIAQNVFFLRRGPLVDPEQAWMLALLNEVGAADVGRQHGFFNHAVRFVAHAGHDLFNLSTFIADDLGFGGFKIHRTPHGARGQQGFVDVLQVQ